MPTSQPDVVTSLDTCAVECVDPERVAAVTGLTQTACSHNLRLLRAHRLVRRRKQGRNVYYALDDAHIRLLIDVALQHLGHREPA